MINFSGLWKNRIRYTMLVCLISLLAYQIIIQSAVAAVFVVNSVGTEPDSNDGDCICLNTSSGLCSIHAAVIEANACPGSDTVQIPPGTYTVDDVSITSEITFQGSGQGVTIIESLVAPGNFTILSVQSDGDLELRMLTTSGIGVSNLGNLLMYQVSFTDAVDFLAAPIRNENTLSINFSTIANNSTTSATSSGGIENKTGGYLTISNSEMYANQNTATSGGGGAILNRAGASTFITNSSIYNNSAAKGGAIYQSSSSVASAVGINLVQIENSSLANNIATGVIDSTGSGGAIYQSIDNTEPGKLVLINSTVSGNEANDDGGAIMARAGDIDGIGTIHLVSTTIADNLANADNTLGGTAGGVYIEDGINLKFKNSIVAGNTQLNGIFSINSDCSGQLTSDGFNLVGYSGAGCTINEAIGDQIGHFSTINALLNPLQGFLITDVHTLQSDSPAIDAGNIAGCRDYDNVLLTVDQVGQDRSRGFVCDIGASESAFKEGRVIVAPLSGLTTTEAGGSARLEFQLNGIPINSVTIMLSSSDLTEGSISSPLVFPSGINQLQTIWVYGEDDAVADGDVDYQITTSLAMSSDPLFDGFDVADISLTNLDDEIGCVGAQLTLVPGDFLPAPVSLDCVATDWIYIDPDSEITGASEVNLTAPEHTIPGLFRVGVGSQLRLITP